MVGVAADVRMQPFDFPRDPVEVYRPLNSPDGPGSTGNQYRYAVVSTDAREGLPPLLKRRALDIDADLPLQVRPMREVFRGSLADPEFQASLLIGFGLLALLLASAGVFAVVTYEACRQSQEIGLRVALGATRTQVIRHVVGRSVCLASAGGTASPTSRWDRRAASCRATS